MYITTNMISVIFDRIPERYGYDGNDPIYPREYAP